MSAYQKTGLVIFMMAFFVFFTGFVAAAYQGLCFVLYMLGTFFTIMFPARCKKDQQRTLTVKSQDGPKE